MTETHSFGEHNDQPVHRFSLVNSSGLSVSVLSYGAIVQNIEFTCKQGIPHSMVLGFDSLSDYVNDDHYIGAMVGRYANRIAHARYEHNGDEVVLDMNAPPHQLHGGKQGLHNRVWDGQPFHSSTSQGVELTTKLKDGESGFPGELTVTVRYELFDDNRFVITMAATTTKTTPVNFTHHGYFTLGRTDNIEPVKLTLNADAITPSDPTLIPTGEFMSVEGTAFDFTQSKAIGQDLRQNHVQLKQGEGYDHNYVLHPDCHDMSSPAAHAVNEDLGIAMSLFTTKPGLQLYSGNFIHHSCVPNLQPHAAFCLEPQFFPDSVNQPTFPSCWLEPDDTYHHTLCFQFEHD